MVSHLRCLGEETASLFGEVTQRVTEEENTENHGEKWKKSNREIVKNIEGICVGVLGIV